MDYLLQNLFSLSFQSIVCKEKGFNKSKEKYNVMFHTELSSISKTPHVVNKL